MNHQHTLLQPVPPPLVQPPKRGFGCLINTLIGLTVLALGLALAAWLILMHSSIPLRTLANLIEKDGAASNLKITGVTGSLSSGLGFEKVTWDNGEITDMRFRFSGLMDVIRRKELIIYEMHLGSATLNTTFFSDDKKTSQTTEPTDDPATKGVSTEPPLRLLRIDRVSLNQIIVKNTATGDTVSIPKIEWTGFKAEVGAELQLGNLVADSDHLVIKTSDPAISGFQKRLEITLLPKLDARILKPIRIDAHLGQMDGKGIFDLKAFDGSVAFTSGPDQSQHLRATGANLADFIDAPLPNKLHLEAESAHADSSEATLTIHSGGSFLLGTKSFTIQPVTTSVEQEQAKGPAFLALCRAGGTEIRYEIPVPESKGKDQSFTPVLTSTPAMKPEDLMALLFHDRKFSALAAPDQDKLRKHMAWFSFR